MAAPSFTWRVDPTLNVTLFGEFVSVTETPDVGLPRRGNAVVPGLPFSRFLGEPTDRLESDVREGRMLVEKQAGNWLLKAALLKGTIENTEFFTRGGALQADGRTLTRTIIDSGFKSEDELGQLEAIGKLNFGGFQHRVTLGVDAGTRKTDSIFNSAPANPIDIFAPVYGRIGATGAFFRFRQALKQEAYGVFAHDNISLSEQSHTRPVLQARRAAQFSRDARVEIPVAMRRALYLVHLYAGLFLGAAVVLVGVTGSAVVYRPEIEHLLNPEWFRASTVGEMRPLDELVANAVRTYPGVVPTFVSIQPPLTSRETAMVVMKDRFGAGSGPWIRAHLDPYTGAVLASFDPRQTFSGVLFDLHSSLLVGEHTWGEQIVGVFGIVLLLFCVTGALLWWPGARRFTRAFKGGLPLKIVWALLDILTILILGTGVYLWLKRGVYRRFDTDEITVEAQVRA
jgi:hypothetical protein